jgi:hypothetical protein
VNEDSLSNVRREASSHFRNKRREYLKDKINEPKSNNKNKNIRDLCRGINAFKKGYKPSTNLVKDDKGDLLEDAYTIVNRWMNSLCQLLNVQRVGVKGRQHSHLCQSLASLRLRMLLEVEKV